MNTREAIADIADKLTDDRAEQLLDYARYLSLQNERADWQAFGKTLLARAYGDDEPEYTAEDLRGKSQP